MRAQIRGLEQAGENIKNGISLLQTTDKTGNNLVNKVLDTAYGDPNFEFTPNPIDNHDIPVIGTDVPVNTTNFVTHYSQLANDKGVLYIYDGRPQYANNTWPSGYSGKSELNVYGEGEVDKDLFLHLKIQVGSNEGQNVTISIPPLQKLLL